MGTGFQCAREYELDVPVSDLPFLPNNTSGQQKEEGSPLPVPVLGVEREPSYPSVLCPLRPGENRKRSDKRLE